MDLSQKILEEFKFDSYKDLFSCVLYDKNLCLNEYIFRGMGSKNYDLIPSVLRDGCQLKLWEWIADSPPKNLSNTEFMQHQLEINLLHEFYRISNKHGLKVPKSSFFEKNPLAPGVMNLFHFTNVSKWIPPELLEFRFYDSIVFCCG